MAKHNIVPMWRVVMYAMQWTMKGNLWRQITTILHTVGNFHKPNVLLNTSLS